MKRRSFGSGHAVTQKGQRLVCQHNSGVDVTEFGGTAQHMLCVDCGSSTYLALATGTEMNVMASAYQRTTPIMRGTQ